MKIVKSLEESGLLTKVIGETIENKRPKRWISSNTIRNINDCNWTRTQNHLVLKRTLNHLAKLAKCILVVSILGNALTGKGVIRTGEGVLKSGQNF